MATPVSKLLPKFIIPTSDKVTACCRSSKFRTETKDGVPVYICTNTECILEPTDRKGTQLVPASDKVTRYRIRPLTTEERGALLDAAMGAVDSGAPHKVLKAAVQLGLSGWENFDAPFETEVNLVLGLKRTVITDATFNQLPYADSVEIAYAVRNYDQLTEEQAKN